jgi:thioredoxin-related protein
MFRSVCVLLLGLYAVACSHRVLDCSSDKVTASEPSTQTLNCINRNLEEGLLIVAEKECVPCTKLLNRVVNESKKPPSLEIVVLWIESDPNRCLEAAQKWGKKVRSYCSSQSEVQSKWGVESTPVVYWVQNQKLREQRGLVEGNAPLPWNIP